MGSIGDSGHIHRSEAPRHFDHPHDLHTPSGEGGVLNWTLDDLKNAILLYYIQKNPSNIAKAEHDAKKQFEKFQMQIMQTCISQMRLTEPKPHKLEDDDS